MRIARSQNGSQRETILAIKDKERMIHVFFIIAVKETQLLMAVGRIIGAIQIDDQLIKVVAPPEPKVFAGEAVHLAFKQETLRFFDPDTTLAIAD